MIDLTAERVLHVEFQSGESSRDKEGC